MEPIDFSSLINTNAEPAQPTLEERKAAFAKTFFSAVAEQFNERVSRFRSLWTYVWRNPDGLSPRQAISAMGTKAGLIFTLSAMEAQYLNTISPGIVTASLPEGVTVTFKPDGSLDQYTEAA